MNLSTKQKELLLTVASAPGTLVRTTWSQGHHYSLQTADGGHHAPVALQADMLIELGLLQLGARIRTSRLGTDRQFVELTAEGQQEVLSLRGAAERPKPTVHMMSHTIATLAYKGLTSQPELDAAYMHPPIKAGEESCFSITSNGRRYKLSVREISPEEELAAAQRHV